MQGFDRTNSITQIQQDTFIQANDWVLNQVGQLWDSFSDKALIYPRLQYAYTARQVCQNLLGGMWPATDYVQAGVDSKLDQFSEHLETLRTQYNDEIVKLEGHAVANTNATCAAMTATAPIMADPSVLGGPFDPNWRGYRGDPTIGTRWPSRL
jgi:hypothetical protein